MLWSFFFWVYNFIYVYSVHIRVMIFFLFSRCWHWCWYCYLVCVEFRLFLRIYRKPYGKINKRYVICQPKKATKFPNLFWMHQNNDNNTPNTTTTTTKKFTNQSQLHWVTSFIRSLKLTINSICTTFAHSHGKWTMFNWEKFITPLCDTFNWQTISFYLAVFAVMIYATEFDIRTSLFLLIKFTNIHVPFYCIFEW